MDTFSAQFEGSAEGISGASSFASLERRSQSSFFLPFMVQLSRLARQTA